MPGQMPPQPQPQPQEDEGQPGPQGAPSDLLAQAMDNLMQVGEMAQKSNALAPEELQQFGTIVGALQKFIQEVLGKAPGQEPQPQQAPGGPAAPEMGGNPRAVPSQF